MKLIHQAMMLEWMVGLAVCFGPLITWNNV